MITFELQSNSLSINGLEDSLAVCFGNLNGDELTSYLMIECSLEGDKICPDNDIYIEINDQSSSVRGGIIKSRLESDSLFLEVNAKTAQELGFEEGVTAVRINFTLDDSEIEELNYALGEVIFKDAGFYEGL